MGFWGALGKLAQGKPVFEDPQAIATPPMADGALPPTPHPWVDDNGQKIIPHIEITHCKSVISGTTMEVTAWVTNTSQLEIELDKIVMIGLKTELDRRLGPGQAHQLKVYRGPVPTNDYAHKANLYYKVVQSDDYFRADYMIEYNRERSGLYSVEDFHPEHDVHDI